MTPAHNPPPYQVIALGPAKESLRRLHREAREQGQEAQLIAAAKEILRRLQIDPMVFGEPRYELRGLQLLIRAGAVAPLIALYGVHRTLPLVFVNDYRLV